MPFGASIGQNILLSDGPALWLRVFPEREIGKTWPAHELKEHAIRNGSLNLAPFSDYNITFLRAEDGIAICSLQTSDDAETGSVAFVFETGKCGASIRIT